MGNKHSHTVDIKEINTRIHCGLCRLGLWRQANTRREWTDQIQPNGRPTSGVPLTKAESSDFSMTALKTPLCSPIRSTRCATSQSMEVKMQTAVKLTDTKIKASCLKTKANLVQNCRERSFLLWY